MFVRYTEKKSMSFIPLSVHFCLISDNNEQAVDTNRSEDICSYGSFKSPSNCKADDCDYSVSWEYNQVTEDISFSITAKQPQDKWTGIGFAPKPAMVVLGFKFCSECSFHDTDKVRNKPSGR